MGASRKYKRRNELFVIEKLFESMEIVGEPLYHSPQILMEDPPDCIAKDECDSLVAFEVTELVDEASVALAAKNKRRIKFWESNELIGRISDMLMDKDSVDYNHTDYSKVILVIFTDEPTLRYKNYIKSLSIHQFPKMKQIDEAYFLFSFDPYERERCPFTRLRLGGNSEAR